jgi:hypothetical protein
MDCGIIRRKGMLKSFEQAAAMINEKKLLHIAGNGELLRKLPRGNWIGGSTEYFMDESGGVISGDALDVQEMESDGWRIVSYDADSLPSIARDAYFNGFSIVIIPAYSEAHRRYAYSAAEYEEMFLKVIAGWLSGFRLGAERTAPLAVNGQTGEALADRAVALHIRLPAGQRAALNIVNIFSPDTNGPVITFDEDSFNVKKCRIDGKEVVFAEYLAENRVDVKLPLVGDYAGTGINISIDSVVDGETRLCGPVFRGIKYRFAKAVPDYAAAFREKIEALKGENPVFACNCLFNFLYGELEGKELGGFYGPVAFGEIAWQLMNQTLVYLRLESADYEI